MISTAEWVAKRGAAYFRKVPLFLPPIRRSLLAYTGPTVSVTMPCIGATSYHTFVTRPLRTVREQNARKRGALCGLAVLLSQR